MEFKWLETQLGEFIELKRGYDLPNKDRAEGDVEIISSSGSSGFHSKAKVKGPGVVTGRYGTIGKVFYSESDFWPLNTTLYVKDFKGNHPEFVYYFLKTLNFLQYSDKAAVPGVNRNHLHKTWIKVPADSSGQRKIAESLSALDKKITLNTQINQTLEQMAQALFKSWFVDFDPVIDNALEAGNPIPEPLAERAAKRQAMWAADNEAAPERLPAETRRLFPDRFEEDEALGWVPAGWSSGCISDISEINAKSWTAKNSPPSVEYVDLANTKNGVIEETACFGFDEAPSRARRVLSPGDTIVGTVRPGNRSYALIGEAHGQLTGSTGFAVLTPKSKELVEFVYLAITRDEVIEEFARLADGGAYPAIKPSVVTEVKIVIPGYSVLLCFNKLLAPMFTKRQSNFCDNYTLKKLRDTLLPKLLSGELQLPDAEAAVDAALEAETA
ncbi:restriction endonuclease subunit S [Modicisalibacter zincidurans]|uniref:Restriction endonuclease subunit S n=1 Tax=Modicisalibacter zincidurans TaxID=1178777 RepID=A0ABP9RHL5_9GAMM|nr:restriction endonuclease subunit S [Halomonas zincidurans]